MKLLFGLSLVWTALHFCAALNDTEFSCCDLPLKIPMDCTHDYELSINGTSFATARNCKANAMAPFKIEGNSVTLEECVEEFTVKIIFNTNSKNNEKTICYRCKPCDPQTDHTGVAAGVGGGGVLVLVLLVICVICELLLG